MELTCGESKTGISNLFVGDVWLLAGQSNMEGCADMTGAAKPHPLVRSFTMSREWRPARNPLHIPMESPDRCHSKGKPFTRSQAEH